MGKRSTRTRETASEIAASIAVEALTAIRKEVRGVIDGSAPSRRGDKTVRIAALAQKAAMVAAEQRKAERGDLDALKRITPAQVILWIRQQPQEARARIARDIAAVDAAGRKNVLG